MSEIATSTTLDLAADAIQMAGWQRGGGWEDRGHGLCLEGGIAAAVGESVMFPAGTEMAGITNTAQLKRCPAYRAVADYLSTTDELFQWNDEDGRTAEDVIEVLRAAAAVERVKEATEARLLGEPTPSYDTEDQPLPIEVAA